MYCDLRPYPVYCDLWSVVVCASLLEETCRYRGFVEAARDVTRRVTRTTTAGGQQRRGALGKAPATNLVLELVSDNIIVCKSQVVLGKKGAAVLQLEKLGPSIVPMRAV